MSLNVRCQRCGGNDTRVGVNLFLDIPPEFYAELTKKNILSNKTKIFGAGWDRAYFYCQAPNCGWSTHLSEVDSLHKEISNLHKEISDLYKKISDLRTELEKSK